jgi:hypothetical protein
MLANTEQMLVVDVEHVYAFQPHLINLHPLTTRLHRVHRRHRQIQHPREKRKVMLENGALNTGSLNTGSLVSVEPKSVGCDDNRLLIIS